MKRARLCTCTHPAAKHVRERYRVEGADACAYNWAQTPDDGLWYQPGLPGEACECTAYQEPPRERVRRGKQAVKAGRKAEQRVAAVTGERVKGGPGNADVGGQEVKVMTAQIRGHVQEEMRHGGSQVYYSDEEGKLGIWCLEAVGSRLPENRDRVREAAEVANGALQNRHDAGR